MLGLWFEAAGAKIPMAAYCFYSIKFKLSCSKLRKIVITQSFIFVSFPFILGHQTD